MIPIKLELKNFLAYSEPDPLDFTGLHVACLVGPNGAGKSSLLDAITWSLWGKARASMDDLVRLGETEMWVRLTFALGDNTYRVMRARKLGKRGQSDLYLEVADGEQWRSITGDHIRQTQAKINTILRLDYDTFINSAYLAQGRADEFTRAMKPAERKALLAEILSLGMWANYEDRAKQVLKRLEMEVAQVDAEMETIDTELARESEYQRALIEKQRRLTAVSDELREAEASFQEAAAHRREWDARRVQFEAVDRRLRDGESELARLKEEYARHWARYEELQNVCVEGDDIRAGYSALLAARAREQAMSTRLLAHGSLREQIGSLEQTIAAERSRLEADLRSVQQRCVELEDEAANSPDQTMLDDVDAQIAALEAQEEALQGMREQAAGIREELAALESFNGALRDEMNKLADQRDRLRAATEATCPLCGQDLTEGHRETLLSELEETGQSRKAIYLENKDRLEALHTDLERLQASIKAEEPELRKLRPLRDRRSTLAERMERAHIVEEHLAGAREQVTVLEATLTEEDYAPEAQAQLAELYEQLSGLGYDEAEHRAAREEIETYAHYEQRHMALEHATEALPEVEGVLANLDERRAVLEERQAEAEAELRELEESLRELDAHLEEYQALEQRVAELRDEMGNARYEVGAAEQRVNALETARTRRADLLDRREDLAEEQSIYEDLRRAFSKDGVPAMVIETAIPEIEQEANTLLGRMTDGRMHVRFDTQREKKTGGAMETLDIRISDELGTRDYATFSGGEAFRVNFAIRLALSRILARRAGAQLRTLIIDEGFGTQDAQGRERLVQVINAVQDEFDLLLVITHIDELKDAFPARIEITKTAHGSQIELI